MEGFVKIETATRGDKTGFNFTSELTNESPFDRVLILNSVVVGLRMDPEEVDSFYFLYKSGIFGHICGVEPISEQRVSVDLSQLLGGKQNES